MADFAKVQDTLGIVHYSRFVVLGDNKTLLFLADIDGDADNLIEALAKSAGPVFDAIFGHVENPPPTPIASKSHAFFEWVTLGAFGAMVLLGIAFWAIGARNVRRGLLATPSATQAEPR